MGFFLRPIMYYLVCNHIRLDFIIQILALYLFAAIPCFAGWVANGGKRDDIEIPIAGSVMLFLLFIVLNHFFRWWI